MTEIRVILQQEALRREIAVHCVNRMLVAVAGEQFMLQRYFSSKSGMKLYLLH